MIKPDMPLHSGSHQHLLSWPDEQPSARHCIDAVIVPTSRPVEYLDEAARLAMELGCPLVTLHSAGSKAAAAAEYLPAAVDLIAIDMPTAESLWLPRLETSRLCTGTPLVYQLDLSSKRNLALALSRLLGWSRIFFLDDDIDTLSPDDVRRAAGLLRSFRAVGLHVTDFPDNSVVCHAYRDAGGEQQSFVGAGALAVDVTRCTSFFPDIYNSDWFFLLDEDRHLLPTAMTGHARQQPYDPFLDPARARSEEFGEVLAEGLFWLLDQGKTIKDAGYPHWVDALERRRALIEMILRVTPDRSQADEAAKRRIAALEAALGQLEFITPRLCVAYLRAWLSDQASWRRFICSLPTSLSLDDALARLCLQAELRRC